MGDIDPFELYRRMPSHQQRLAAEKQVNVYYVPGVDAKGDKNFIYAVCSNMLHESFVATVRNGVIPDYAVVVEIGTGEPDAKIKAKMLEYYGFDHDNAESGS